MAEATGKESKKRKKKEQKKKKNPSSRILSLILGRIFLGISSLGISTISFGLRFSILGLRDYILDCEGVLEGFILRWWLSFLIHSCPLRNVGVRKGSLGRKELLGRRVRIKNLSDIL